MAQPLAQTGNIAETGRSLRKTGFGGLSPAKSRRSRSLSGYGAFAPSRREVASYASGKV